MEKINLSGFSAGTWTKIIVYAAVVVNQIALSLFDVTLIPFAEEELYEIVSELVTLITFVVASYLDLPVTKAGQVGHKTTKELKGE